MHIVGKKKRWQRNDRKGGNKKLPLWRWIWKLIIIIIIIIIVIIILLKLSSYYFTYKIKET